MGQKVNPTGFRIGTFYPWKSRWFSDDAKYKVYLFEDIKIRKVLMDRLKLAGITSVVIERLPKSILITLSVSRPGVVIGRGGTGLEDVKRYIIDTINEDKKEKVGDLKIDIRVTEVKNPEISAYLVASRIASEIERRMPYRKVISRAVERVMMAGAKGVKVVLAGRIAGAEISRTEKFHQGSVPTQTLRKNIDYAQLPALQKKGYVGIKVYIYKDKEE